MTLTFPQVFALDMNLKSVYFRTGVTRSDLTGKTWQEVRLDEDLSDLHRLGLISDDSQVMEMLFFFAYLSLEAFV